MKRSSYHLPVITVLSTVMLSCSTPKPSNDRDLRFTPSEVVDLGASVTEDLPQRVWGKGLPDADGLYEAEFIRRH